MRNVRITVLRIEFYPELADEYLAEGRQAGACPLHAVGDSYLYTGGAEKPDGLCPWAWMDLYRTVSALYSGADENDWYTDSRTRVECCTDGVRPVIFEIRAEDGECGSPGNVRAGARSGREDCT